MITNGFSTGYSGFSYFLYGLGLPEPVKIEYVSPVDICARWHNDFRDVIITVVWHFDTQKAYWSMSDGWMREKGISHEISPSTARYWIKELG